MDTLANARRELWEAMKAGGGECACCKRFAKLYRYSISKAQISASNWIVRKSGVKRAWVNVQDRAPKWLLRSNSHGKLVHWGLLEQQPASEDGIHHSGVWRPTEFGMQFFHGNANVLKYALVFNNECLGRDGDEVSYNDLFDEFHYGELMKATALPLHNRSASA